MMEWEKFFLAIVLIRQVKIVLTFGTNMSNILRKQQKITASATNAKDASCCDAITIATGAVIKHNTAILYILIPTYLESFICLTLIDLVS